MFTIHFLYVIMKIGKVFVMKNNLEEDIKRINLLKDDEISEMNFYEACLYLEKLNVLDKIVVNDGDKNE